jgi:hypothetical protein
MFCWDDEWTCMGVNKENRYVFVNYGCEHTYYKTWRITCTNLGIMGSNVFGQGGGSKPYALTISTSAMKLCCIDDFLVGSDSVFVNDFWVSRKPYALTISTSIMKLCCIDDLWVGSDSVFINDF